MEWDVLDEPGLEDLAAKVSRVIRPGDVIVLSGELGAGKTTFVRAAARVLGILEPVVSPTYQIARTYAGQGITVNHLDLYRVNEVQEQDSLDLDEYLDPAAVTFIEWAEPALSAIKDPTVVRISYVTPTTRRVSITGPVEERLA